MAQFKENRTFNYRGTFDLKDEKDQAIIKHLRDELKAKNKEFGTKKYLKLQGRGDNRRQRCLDAGLSTHHVAQSIPLSVAEYADAYVYER